MTRQCFSSVAVTFALLLSLPMIAACSTKNSQFGTPETPIRKLNYQEQVDAMEIYLPWARLREALEVAPDTDLDSQTAPDVAPLVEELRKNCRIRRSADTQPAVEKLGRISTIEITAGSGKESCPIEYRRDFTFQRMTSVDGSQVQGRLRIVYRARNARALELAPFTKWIMRGPIERTTESDEQGELRHSQKENLMGDISVTQYEQALQVSLASQSLTKFRGARSATSESETRQIKMPGYWAEWQRARELDDGKLIEERHFINREAVSRSEMEKLQRDVRQLPRHSPERF